MILEKFNNNLDRTLKQRFDALIVAYSVEVKKVNRNIARDTGDMSDAATPKLSRVEGMNLVGEVYYNINELYKKRKPYRYKRGTRKGSYAKPDRNYPAYVIRGTKTKEGVEIMKARPIFTIAWNNIKQKPVYQDIAKNIILRGNE